MSSKTAEETVEVMADNFLEKQMEAWRQGSRPTYSSGMSLECLLERLRKMSAGKDDESYHIHSMQMSAIVDVATKAMGESGFDLSVEQNHILIKNQDGQNLLELGALVEIIILKAAEMNLYARVESKTDQTIVLVVSKR